VLRGAATLCDLAEMLLNSGGDQNSNEDGVTKAVAGMFNGE
jgi:hypothetical protein